MQMPGLELSAKYAAKGGRWKNARTNGQAKHTKLLLQQNTAQTGRQQQILIHASFRIKKKLLHTSGVVYMSVYREQLIPISSFKLRLFEFFFYSPSFEK